MEINSQFSTPVLVILLILSGICIIVTVGGNLLVLLAFFVERSLRTPTNYLIESLAVTDLLIGLISMSMFTMYVILGQWPLSTTVCNLWLAIDYTACLTSQYTVFFITLDRFCSVKFPTRYREWRTKKIVILVILGTWILPGLLFFTIIFGWPYFNSDIVREEKTCDAEFIRHFYFNIILTFGYFWSTLLVMLSLYVGIYCVALKLQRKSYKRRLLTSTKKLQNSQVYNMNFDNSNNCLANPDTGGAGDEKKDSLKPKESNDGNQTRVSLISTNESNTDKLPSVSNIDNPPRLEERRSSKAARFKFCRDSRKYRKKVETNSEIEIKKSFSLKAPVIQTEFHSAPVYNRPKAGNRKNYVPESSDSFYDEDEDSNASVSSSFLLERKKKHSIIVPIIEALSLKGFSSKIEENSSPNLDTQPESYRESADTTHQQPIFSDDKEENNKICFKNFLCMCECCFRNCNSREILSSRHRGHSENRAIKALRTISLIMGAFIICWTPYHILVLVKSVCGDCIESWQFNISYWLCYMNSPINPFCYALANVQIKKTLIRLLKCDFRRT